MAFKLAFFLKHAGNRGNERSGRDHPRLTWQRLTLYGYVYYSGYFADRPSEIDLNAVSWKQIPHCCKSVPP